MPSFTFVSTANAFALRGAKIVYVDVRPDTMNIDEKLIESAITAKTKAIVVVHYGGVSCEMNTIKEIAEKHDLLVVEDAAQCIGATYKGKALGSIGDLGAYSFHDTKNIHCGEGGALLINNKLFRERAEIIREKGTNRSKFLRGQIDKYTWVDTGSSYLPSELNAAFLYAQLESEDAVTKHRVLLWNKYAKLLGPLENAGHIELCNMPSGCLNNGHLFYIKCRDIDERDSLIGFLREKDITASFHYIPLHSSVGNKNVGHFHGEDLYTTAESERLVRLPMYYDLNFDQIDYVVKEVKRFYHES